MMEADPVGTLHQELMRLKEENKILKEEKFQLVLDCDKLKCDFQEFIDNIHPLRDCHPGPDVGDPLMPYEIAAFKRDPVNFADLDPELREPLVREMQWRIEDSNIRRHALKFLQAKREERYMGPEFEPEARKVARELALASFEAHKNHLAAQEELEPLPNSPIITSWMLPLKSGDERFTITLTDDINTIERGFEVIKLECCDAVGEKCGQEEQKALAKESKAKHKGEIVELAGKGGKGTEGGNNAKKIGGAASKCQHPNCSCTKGYYFVHAIFKHMVAHGPKRYACSKCDITAHQLSNLQYHFEAKGCKGEIIDQIDEAMIAEWRNLVPICFPSDSKRLSKLLANEFSKHGSKSQVESKTNASPTQGSFIEATVEDLINVVVFQQHGAFQADIKDKEVS